MTARNSGPRPGSRVHVALTVLHAIGGKATLVEWMRALEYTGAIGIFQRDVVAHLGRWKLITTTPSFAITAAGLDLLGIPVDAPPLAPRVVVGAPYTIEPRELSPGNMPRLMLTRPGALDYLDIPSRMGGQRIPHFAKA